MCPNLIAIEFCQEIEQFVNEVQLLWWNRGVSEESSRTFSFLVKDNILERLRTIKMRMWKTNIHSMLQRIPEELVDDVNEGYIVYDCYEKGYIYIDSISSRLSNYERAQVLAPFLELILWQTKIMERSNYNIDDETKRSCRLGC